jgi:N-acetylmuramoyl-L-alanine amidase
MQSLTQKAGKRSRWFVLVSGLWGAWGQVVPPQSVEPTENADRLQDIRVWSTGDVTRVALETSGEVHFQRDRLSNPERIYVDLLDTLPSEKRGLGYRVDVNDGLIRQIRVALNQKSTTRVVLDLDALADFSVSQLANPYRVMIEVRRLGPLPSAPAPAVPVPSPAVLAPPVETVVQQIQRPPPRRFIPPPQVLARSRYRPRFILTERPPRLAAAGVPRTNPFLAVVTVPEPPRDLTTPAAEPLLVAAKATNPAPIPSARTETRIPLPAQRNRSGSRSLTRVLGLKLNRVVLDPGHGGSDHGSTGPGGLVEKELVLDVAQRLGKLIEERLGAEVVYTRTSDDFVPLETRTKIANDQHADLFLSIHANSSGYKAVSGVETYYLSFSASKEDLEVAARENAGSERSIHELSDLVRQIAQQDKADESRDFAARIQSASYALARQSYPRARNRGVKKAPFVVLIGASMPSVLTEIGFVSNAREEALLKRPDYRQKIAGALFKGVEAYAETLSHFNVASSAGGQ